MLLPNLWTVPVNSVDSTGVQLHLRESAQSSANIRIQEEERQLSDDSTLNTNDLTHLGVQVVVDEERDQHYQVRKRL